MFFFVCVLFVSFFFREAEDDMNYVYIFYIYIDVFFLLIVVKLKQRYFST